MSQRARRLMVIAGTLFCFIALTATAGAATVYVSGSAPVVPGGRSCAQPDYSTVQAGITGAKGGTVDICAGTYTEQIAITEGAKLDAVSGINTATLAMPANAVDSETSCDTKGGLQQIDEISICSGKVSISGLDVRALIPLETCGGGLNGIFVGGEGVLKAANMTVDGASTTLDSFKGCQHGVAIDVGSETADEVGHASLKNVTVSGYEKNGPTVSNAGSTLSISNSTITGEGESPWIGQNGIQVAFGAKGTIRSTSVSANECSLPGICGPEAEQATGVLFYQAAPGSSLSGSTVKDNDGGVYYASGSDEVPSTPEVSISKDVLTSNRYEGVYLEEGKASLKGVTINGSGRVGVDLYQRAYQQSASESVATGMKISGQAEAAIRVESNNEPGDTPGKFVISKSTETENGSLLINDSNDFEVIF